MKPRHFSTPLGLILLSLTPAGAADIFKAANTTNMNSASSWIGGVLPSAADTIVFDDQYTLTNTTTAGIGTGAPLGYAGIRIEGSTQTGLITIYNTTTANHVAPGAGGIDMSNSPRNFQVQSLQVNVDQTWNIGSPTGNRTLTLGGSKLAGSGQVTVEGNGNLVLGANNTLTKGIIITGARMQTGSPTGFGSAAVTHSISGNASAYISNNSAIPANFEIAGNGWVEPTSSQLGAIRLTGGSLTGNITLTGDARITAHGNTGTLSGVISDGGAGHQLELGNFNTGTNTTLTVSGAAANTYSGGTLVTGAIVRGLKAGAFGTGPITVQSNGTATRAARLQLEGITLANSILLDSTAQTEFRGALHASGGLTSVVNGSVTINAPVGNGGHLAAENNTTSILRIMGPINVSGPITTPAIRIGTVELGGGGNYAGLNHNQGTLRLAADNGINSGANLTAAGSGDTTFDLAGFDQTLGNFNTNSFVSTLTNSHPTEPSTLTLAGSGNQMFRIFDPTTAPLNIVKTGNSTLSVTGTSPGTSPGSIAINAGTLNVSGKLGGSATTLTLADGTTLAGEGILGGNTTLGASTGAKLSINAETPVSLLVDGNPTVNGVLEVSITANAILPPIDVLGYSGTITASPANFSAPRLRGATFDIGTGTNSTVTMNVAPAVNLVWTGSVNNTWDAGTDTNWLNPSNAADKFFEFDNVSFTDAAAGTGELTVSIPTGITAGTITFNHSTKDYRLTGPGGFSGGTLVKSGTGTLTLATAGSHTGFTDIEAGTLVADFTNGNPLASTQDIAIFEGATLRLVHDDGPITFDRTISGAGTIVFNPHNAAGTDATRSVAWTGTNSGFSGHILLASPVTGTSRLNGTLPETFGSASIAVASGNQFYTAAQTYSNPITIAGDGLADSGGFLGALRLETNAVWNGNVTITGSPGDSNGTTADARIGVFSGNGTINGTVSGGDLRFSGYNTTSNDTLILSAANSFGDLIVEASDTPASGQVTVIIGDTGSTNTTATLGTGDVHLIGGAAGKLAAIRIQRGDGYTLQQDILGSIINPNTVFIADVLGAGLTLNGHTVEIGQQVRLGGNLNGAVLNIDAGSTVNAGFIFTGNATNNSTTLNQTGGTVTVSDHVRIAHWPTETSVWNMSGGTLNITGIPANPGDGGPGGGLNEVPGMLYVGLDGQGSFNQSGGAVSAYGLVIDSRGDSLAGTNMATGLDEYNLTGGTLTLNASGIRGNASSAFNLGGGTLIAAADFTSTLPLNITAPGSTLQTSGFTLGLNGGIPGSGSLTLADNSPGGTGTLVFDSAANLVIDASLGGKAKLRKQGAGTLTLAGANTFTGTTEVWDGTLALTGSLSGSNLVIDGGALATGGSLAGNLGFSPGFDSAITYTGSPTAVTGNLTLSGPTEVNPLAAGTLAAGSYPLVTFSGSLTGAVSNLELPAGFLPAEFRQTFAFTATANAINLVVTGNIGDLTWNGPGDWDINTSAAFSGGSTFFQADKVTFNDTAASGLVNLVGSLTPSSLVVNNNSLPYIFSGTGSITGDVSLIKQGPGTLTVNNANTYTGGTILQAGRLEVGAVGALGTGPVTISSGTLRVFPEFGIPNTQTIILGDATSGTSETILELPVNTTTTGDKLIFDAPIIVSSSAPGSKAILRYPGGTSGAAMRCNSPVTLENRDLHLENTSDVNPTTRLWNMGGRITGTGNVHIDVPGPNPNARVRLLNTGNDFVGDVLINSGFLQLGNGSGGLTTAIPDTSNVVVAADATFALGAGDTIAGLSGAGAVRANLGTATNTVTLTVGASDASAVFNGTTLDLHSQTGGGRVALTKIGTGTQVMNGVCEHLGATAISGGTLQINNTFASAVTVGAAGTLSGTGTLGSTLTATAVGAKVNPGAGIGTLSVTGNANLSTGGTLEIEIDDASTPKNDVLAATANLNISDATLTVLATGIPAQNTYIIASYDTLSGTFAVTNVPLGYEIDYNHNSANQIALVKIGAPGDYETWAQSFGLNPAGNGAPGEDADNDGLINEAEYLFGLAPNSGASVSPIIVPFDATAGTFTYTRRRPALSGRRYDISTSITLNGWDVDDTAVQQILSTANDIETVRVTLTPTLLTEPKLFARVEAVQQN
jgi:autotransporter-associated beta strand protein